MQCLTVTLLEVCTLLTGCLVHTIVTLSDNNVPLVTGALVEWGKVQAGQPRIVNGLGVVKNHKGKLRLILDCRYLNLFYHMSVLNTSSSLRQ